MHLLLLLLLVSSTCLAFQTVDDMRLPDGQMMTTGYRKWTGGIVPYVVTNQFTTIERTRIHDALSQLNTKLDERIRFIPRENNEYNYVKIIKGSGCWSYVGQVSGVQELSLGTGCVTRGIIQHEFIHAIGFLHAHQRTDRDDYIEIRSHNIIDGATGNFKKERYDSRYSTPYDYKSVMHYHSTAFSKNGEPTIVPVGDYTGDLGNYDQVTDNDVLRMTRMYGAPVPTTPSPTRAPTTPAPTLACTPGLRGMQLNAFKLGDGPMTMRWNPGDKVWVTLGDYLGKGNKYNKRWWRGRKTMSIRRGRRWRFTWVRAPGARIKLTKNELTVAAIGPDKLRIGNMVINFPLAETLDILIWRKSGAIKLCRT